MQHFASFSLVATFSRKIGTNRSGRSYRSGQCGDCRAHSTNCQRDTGTCTLSVHAGTRSLVHSASGRKARSHAPAEPDAPPPNAVVIASSHLAYSLPAGIDVLPAAR